MATTDLEQFIQERLRSYDPNVDLTTGSAADQEVVQPILRRVGPDPFTMPLERFITTRLQQEFPDITTTDGDAISDLLLKPARVLMEPLVQEVKRVRDNLSLADTSIMTLPEVEALGANYFVPRNRGEYSRVRVRIYYSAPQNAVITPANYCYTGTGLRFLPTSIQSISSSEMSFNKEGSYYYFDVNTVASFPGDVYNVTADSIKGVYGVTAAVKVTNKMDAAGGLPAQTAAEYADGIQQSLSERSPVTLRGLLAVIRDNFPAITRSAVVGFNDPEMQRDVLQGAGVGPILAAGSLGHGMPDGEGASYTRRFRVDDASADFTATVGPAGLDVTGYSLTVAGPILKTGDCADFTILRVVDSKTVDLEVQEIINWYSTSIFGYWMVRKNQLTLSGVEGGTELPGTNGEVTINSDEVHIGGMTDVYIRGADTDQGTLTLSAVTDDEPLLSGIAATKYEEGGSPVGFYLEDFVMGTDYQLDDAIYTALDTAKDKGLIVQLMDGDVGSYRILDVVQANGASPIIYTDPYPAGYPLNQRWRMVDVIDINLLLPTETKLSGGDLLTIQGHNLAQVASVSDLSIYGIGKDDYLEIITGADAGTFVITEDTTTNQLTLDRTFTFSNSGVAFRIYRRMSTEDINLPLVRVKSIDVLDTSGEPIGSTVPLANPVDVRSFDFTAPTNTPKIDIRDGIVGCVGKKLSTMPSLAGKVLRLTCPVWVPSTVDITLSAVGSVGALADAINSFLGDYVATVIDDDRLAFTPVRGQYTLTVSPAPVDDASVLLFDTTVSVTSFGTNHIRSVTVDGYSQKWATYDYDANFDAVQVVSTTGSYFSYNPVAVQSDGVLQVDRDFLPSVNSIVTVGPRSVGKVRAYFVDPTTIEVGPTTRFEAVMDDGSVLSYVPDPTIDSLRYPPPPSEERVKDATTTNSSPYGVLTSYSVDFIKKNILPGDKLVVDYIPIIGDKAVTDPTIPGLALTTFIVKMNGVYRTLVFTNDYPSDTTAVTALGVEEQLNKVLGANVAKFNSSGYLEIEPSYELAVTGGTSLGYFWLNFGSMYPNGVSNLSPNYQGGKRYTVYYVGKNSLNVTELFPDVLATRQQFKIYRPGTQRVGTTQMALNKTYASLYYADFQLVSEGTDSQYNIQHGQKLSVSGHSSFGYWLTTEHEHLSFSLLEKMHLHMTPTISTVGASDDPENALHLTGQNMQVNYAWSSLVSSFQSFLASDDERVTNANMLVRHLLPYYVRYDVTYRGGATESTINTKSEEYIASLLPSDSLEAVKLQNIPLTQGATSVSTPINLVALVYKEDRSVDAEQSTDYLNTGRLAGFFVDSITVQRKTS